MQVEDNNAFMNNLAECKYRVTGMIEMTVIGFLSLRCVGEPDAELRLHGGLFRRNCKLGTCQVSLDPDD